MARPDRHDADYFPFIVKRGRTLNILQNKYGLEGIGFFTNLMRFLCQTPDHFYCFSGDINKFNFFAEIGIEDEVKGIAMIELMIKTEKLDKDLWENHQVIFCPALLESLKDAYDKRRNNIITIEEIREKFEKNDGNPAVATLNDPETQQSEEKETGNPADPSLIDPETPQGEEKNDGNPQRKKKETKLEESKENIDGSDEPSPDQKSALELSSLLLNSHRSVIPDFLSGKDDQKTIERWAGDIELLIRIDKKSPETIREVISWAKSDKFWFSNIVSGKKLREKFETLYGQMKTKTTGPSVSSHQQRKIFLE